MAELINNLAASAGVATGLGKVALVSGGTGFLGSAVVLAFVERGFYVHATARSQEKAQAWLDLHNIAANRVKFFIVKDVAEENAFDEALQGVDTVAHTASPFHFNAPNPEEDLLKPAIQGTLSIMRSAAKVPSVKRVVVTSSFASVLDMDKAPAVGTTYTHADWNPATYERAAKSADNPAYAYCASKVLAEKAAWDFVEKEKPGFSLSTVCPPMVLGPNQQVVDSLDNLNTSSSTVWALISGKTKEIPSADFPVGTDVRDIAKAHVLAASLDVARGQRYLTIAFHYNNEQAADVLRKAFPDKADRIPAGEVKPLDPHFATDSSKAEKELGITWIPFDKCVTDTATKLFAIEKQLQQKQ